MATSTHHTFPSTHCRVSMPACPPFAKCLHLPTHQLQGGHTYPPTSCRVATTTPGTHVLEAVHTSVAQTDHKYPPTSCSMSIISTNPLVAGCPHIYIYLLPDVHACLLTCCRLTTTIHSSVEGCPSLLIHLLQDVQECLPTNCRMSTAAHPPVAG